MNANKVISLVTGILVLSLAVISFVLSYAALHGLALGSGAVLPGLAWAWPLVVDGALVVFSMTILRGSLQAERTWWSWALVLAFCALSVGFNIAHAPSNILAQLVASVPPVALLLSFESLMAQVRGAVKRRGVSQSLQVMEKALQAARQELADLEKQADALQARLSTTVVPDAQPDTLALARTVKGEQDAQSKATALDTILSTLTAQPNVTITELARLVNKSRTTVYTYLAELESAGRLRRNGHNTAGAKVDTLPVAALDTRPAAMRGAQ